MGIFNSKFEERYREELKRIDEKFECQRVERLRTDEELRKANQLIQETKCELEGKMQERIKDAKNTKEELQQMKQQTNDAKENLQQMKQQKRDTNEELQQMKQDTKYIEELQQMKQQAGENAGIWASSFIAITLGEFVWSLLKQPQIKTWSASYLYDNFTTQFDNVARVLELGSVQLSKKLGRLIFYRNSKAHVSDWAEMDNRLLQCQKLFAIYPTLQKKMKCQLYVLKRATKHKTVFLPNDFPERSL